MRTGAGACFLAFALNGSLAHAVDLVTCSGYHVAAFSLVFRIFLLGASLRQCAPPQKQARVPSSWGYRRFSALAATIYIKYEVPCKRVISCRELFRIFRREKLKKSNATASGRWGMSGWSVRHRALRNIFCHTAVLAGKVYCLSGASFDFPG